MPKKKEDAPPTFDAATEAELDRAAEITEADIADAQEMWRESASPEFRTLLDAKEIEE